MVHTGFIIITSEREIVNESVTTLHENIDAFLKEDLHKLMAYFISAVQY